MTKILLLIFTSILFSGCNQKILHPQITKDIEALLNIKPIVSECKYPKLPTYKVPQEKRVAHGTSLESAFKECVEINKKLRHIIWKQNIVAFETNKRYIK